MLRAIQGDSNTNVIATPRPSPWTTRRPSSKSPRKCRSSPAVIQNGDTDDVNPFTTVQREEVGTILKITPQVNEGGALVQLKIDLESSELSGDLGDADSLITNKRTVNTNVLIEDGGIVVLGGLIRDSATRGEHAYPISGVSR